VNCLFPPPSLQLPSLEQASIHPSIHPFIQTFIHATNYLQSISHVSGPVLGVENKDDPGSQVPALLKLSEG
jgi:hypothetical protein